MADLLTVTGVSDRVGLFSIRPITCGCWAVRWLLALLAIFAAVPVVTAQQVAGESSSAAAAADTVVDVRIRGNKSLSLDRILPHIRTRAGRPFDLEQIEEDVRRLDHTHMFVDVKTYWQQTAGGRIVVFDVLERPLLQELLFVGCKKIKKKALQKESGLKVGDALDPFAVEEARRKLEEFYHERGFSGARITLLEGDKPEDRRAVFLINEGNKQRIFRVKFVGNTIASDERLKTQIQSKTPFLYLFKGELDRRQVDEDVDRLTAYYRGLGYFDARIGRELESNEKKDWVTITFVIDEGIRFKVRNVSVLGNQQYASDELLTELDLRDNEYFNQAKLTRDVAMLQEKYGSIGYVFADIKADPRYLEEPGQLDLVYNITEGDRYRVGKINVDIKGEYPHTQITTVLNRLSFKPGDIVDIREIRASERRLRASGLFESNPATGGAPKVVFSPPDRDEEDTQHVAERPESPPPPASKFRGQSPDPTTRDQTLDLTLDCGRYVTAANDTERLAAADHRFAAVPAAARGETGPTCRRPLNNSRIHSLTVTRQRYDGEADTSAQQNSDLLRMADELTDALSHDKRRQSPARLIPTQYTPETSQTDSTAPSDGLQWTSAAVPEPQTAATEPAYRQPAPTQSTPVEPAPAYGQQMWPRQGPERVVDSPEGPYLPGPIFSESSPFRDGPPDGGDPPRMLDFDVIANEAMTGRMMFGVGVNSDAGLVGSIVLDEQNFDWTRFPNSWEDIRNATAWRGAGQRFRLEAVPGTEVQRYMATFQDPYMFDTGVSMGLSGYYYSRYYTEWKEQRVGGRVAFGYQFSPDLSGNIAYRGAKINITDPIDPLLPDLLAVTGHNLAMHGFQLSLTHDKRDNAFMATEGHLFEASAEQVLGSFSYPRVEIDLRKYFTLYERPDGSGRHVLSLASRAGYTGDDTPIYERFYAGGFSTIRGFQFRGASPQQIGPSTGGSILVGGNFQLLASAEYLFPITADDMLRGVVFCDTGTVEPTIDNWSDRYRVAPGFGLRIAVPAMGPAPIALDFAFPIAWQPGDRREMFSFFMGFGR